MKLVFMSTMKTTSGLISDETGLHEHDEDHFWQEIWGNWSS